MAIHKNCIPRKPVLSLEKSARLHYLCKGLEGERSCIRWDTLDCLAPGDRTDLFHEEGSGFLSTLFLTLKGSELEKAATSTLRVYCGAEEAAVICQPIRDFFMSGLEGKEIIGDYFGKSVSTDGTERCYYRHIFIPYCSGCRIEVENNSGTAFGVELSVHMNQTAQPTDYGRYSNSYGAVKTGRSRYWGEKIVLLDVKGQGAFHSFQFSMRNLLTHGEYMEGNMEIYIDNNAFPEYQSTGTEEFFMGGVYFTNLHTSAFSSCTRTFNDGSDNPQHIISAQRLFVDDVITFNSRLRIVWHNGQPNQGTVTGSTDYSFAGIYYLYGIGNSGVLPAEASWAQQLLSAKDRACFTQPAFGKTTRVTLLQKETQLLSLSGPGRLETLGLCGVANLSQAMLTLEIDGERSDSVPVDWFFLNGQEGGGFTTGPAGKPGSSAYYRCCDIQFRRSLRILIEKGTGEWDVFAQHRTGASDRFYRTVLRRLSYEQVQADPTVLAQAGAAGLLECLLVCSEQLAQPTVLELTDMDTVPLLVNSLSALLLTASDMGNQTGAAAELGILNYKSGQYLGYRLFIENRFSFVNGLRLRLVRYAPAKAQVMVMLKLLEEGSIAEPMTVPQLTTRLNQNDFATECYETRCYNPIEGHDGLVAPGQTAVMFEDFDAGMIQCIRFGTPPVGSALHESQLRLYLDGSETPAVDTTFGRFFSAEFHDPIFWCNTRYLTRLSKRGGDRPKNQGQHSSFLRYINLPYSTGCRFTLTAPPDSEINGFDNVYYASARQGGESFGILHSWKMATGSHHMEPNTTLELLQCQQDSAITSVQMMLESEQDNRYLYARLQAIGPDGTVYLDAPLYSYFLGAAPEENCPSPLHAYNDFWAKQLQEEEAYYSAPEHGWIRRGTRLPYRNVMYRLLDHHPMLLPAGSRLQLIGVDTSCTLMFDIMVRSKK